MDCNLPCFQTWDFITVRRLRGWKTWLDLPILHKSFHLQRLFQCFQWIIFRTLNHVQELKLKASYLKYAVSGMEFFNVCVNTRQWQALLDTFCFQVFYQQASKCFMHCVHSLRRSCWLWAGYLNSCWILKRTHRWTHRRDASAGGGNEAGDIRASHLRSSGHRQTRDSKSSASRAAAVTKYGCPSNNHCQGEIWWARHAPTHTHLSRWNSFMSVQGWQWSYAVITDQCQDMIACHVLFGNNTVKA